MTQSSSTRNTGAMPSCEAAVECLPVDCGALPAVAEVARFRGAEASWNAISPCV